jgi:hypothetical protein
MVMGRPNKNEDEREEPLVAVLLANSFSRVRVPMLIDLMRCRHGQPPGSKSVGEAASQELSVTAHNCGV